MQRFREKRNLGFVKLRRGLREHLHRSRMSSNASTLFVWLLLSAHHSGPRKGCVEADREDIMRGLGWTYSMTRRATYELTSKRYILVTPAANQHEVTVIRILKFDTDEEDSAVLTGEHPKDVAVSTAVLSAVSTSEQGSEHSTPSNFLTEQDLEATKNAVEVKKEKNERLDAVRRRFDAELPAPNRNGFSLKEKNKKLRIHLAAAIEKKDDCYANWVKYELSRGQKHPFGQEERDAFAATGYTPDLDSPLLSFDFVMAVVDVYSENQSKDISPGNFCSKIIDHCERERKRCEGGFYWPPDFKEHRDELRKGERRREAINKAAGARA